MGNVVYRAEVWTNWERRDGKRWNERTIGIFASMAGAKAALKAESPDAWNDRQAEEKIDESGTWERTGYDDDVSFMFYVIPEKIKP